jgi:hypothetical protein
MYRFLDKRFYHKPRWEFDLTEFACEHIGVSRNYDTGQLKRRLQPAIAELEAVGFLEVLPVAQRYVKISRGEWRIVFLKKAVSQIEPPTRGAELLIKRLTDRGVTPSVATELVRDYPPELIAMQMEVLERLQQVKERESIRNPAGYLVKSIREGYVPPQKLLSNKLAPKTPQAPKIDFSPPHDPFQVQIDAYLQGLSKSELADLEQESLGSAESTLLDGYHRSRQTGGAASVVYRRMILERGAKRRLLAATEPTKSVS